MDYRELLVLRAARETGVLDALTLSAGTPADIADEAGVTERAARVALDVLDARGFVTRVGDQYEITNRSLGFVAKADVRSIGRVPHDLDCLDRALDLAETMRTGEPPAEPDDWTVNFMGSMATVDEATVRACVTAAVREHPDAERVLDVGGGPGVFATEFVRRGLDVTLFDRPDVVDVDRRLLEHADVDLVAGDALDGLPGGFDLVFCARVAHMLGPEENRTLVANAADALAPDGALVVVDYLRDRSALAPTIAAHMLAQTERGDAYGADEFGAWFDAAGLAEIRVEDVPGTDLQAVAGRSIQ